MKKFLLAVAACISLTCFSFSFQSCNEESKEYWINLFAQYFGNDTTSQYYKILGNDSLKENDKYGFLADMIDKFIAAKTCDSTEFMAGVWAYQSNDGDEIDTFWFYRDSTVMEHYISKSDTLDVQYSGGYLYYKSFEQAIVQFNNVYNYKTNRNIEGYSEYHIFEVSNPAWMQALGVKQLTMTDLDTETGEPLSSIAYSYVEDVE